MEQAVTGQVTLSVGGMTCGGCAASVERALTRAPGVRRAAVDLAAGQATVEYEPGRTDPQRLAAVVSAAGFEVGRLQ